MDLVNSRLSTATSNSDDETPDFVTLGMFIIDEIHFSSQRPPALDILGGAGSWSIIGARLASPNSSKKLSWVIHRGSDFPSKIQTEIDGWDTSCVFIDTPERLTTRGWNEYGENEHRAFKYLSEKIRIDEAHLTPSQLRSKSFHLICSPRRCISVVKGILRRRSALASEGLVDHNPLFIWEPVPDAVTVEAYQDILKALEWVDVISPNHHEFAALFGATRPNHDRESAEGLMDSRAQELLSHGFGARAGAIVIRAGEEGSHVYASDGTFTLPAYQQDQSKVIDPTGAGNAYLGAFAVGMVGGLKVGQTRHQATLNGAISGSIAAGFALEQIGMPSREGHGLEERWNGSCWKDREAEYRSRPDVARIIEETNRRT